MLQPLPPDGCIIIIIIIITSAHWTPA